MTDTLTPFEIRNYVSSHADHPADVQAIYDDINTVATGTDGIKFSELFMQPVGPVSKRILKNLENSGLGNDALKKALCDLSDNYGDISLHDLVGKSDEGVRAIFTTLRDNHFPLMEVLTEENNETGAKEQIQGVIRNLVGHAGHFAYQEIHSTASSDDTLLASKAIAVAQGAPIIPRQKNGMCCGPDGVGCVVGMSTNWCTVVDGECSIGASFC